MCSAALGVESVASDPIPQCVFIFKSNQMKRREVWNSNQSVSPSAGRVLQSSTQISSTLPRRNHTNIHNQTDTHVTLLDTKATNELNSPTQKYPATSPKPSSLTPHAQIPIVPHSYYRYRGQCIEARLHSPHRTREPVHQRIQTPAGHHVVCHW